MKCNPTFIIGCIAAIVFAALIVNKMHEEQRYAEADRQGTEREELRKIRAGEVDWKTPIEG